MKPDPIQSLLTRCRKADGSLDEEKLAREIHSVMADEWTLGWIGGWNSGSDAVRRGMHTGYVPPEREHTVQSLESFVREAQARAWEEGWQENYKYVPGYGLKRPPNPYKEEK
jgi:hypothetical protein